MLAQILTGQAGGSWFEVLASTITEVKQPAIVPIEFEVSGKNGTSKIGDGIDSRFAPIRNPVTGDEASVQVRIPGGLEYSDQGEAEILRSEVMRSADEIGFDHTGGYTSL